MLHGFNEKDSKRIGKSVKFTERQTQDQAIITRRHKKRSLGGGSNVLWAQITAVTDVNNYTVDIYNREDEGTPLAEDKACRVFDIVDVLAIDNWISVQTSSITDVDYESIQALGALLAYTTTTT